MAVTTDHPRVKLEALAEGARLASKELWGRAKKEAPKKLAASKRPAAKKVASKKRAAKAVKRRRAA